MVDGIKFGLRDFQLGMFFLLQERYMRFVFGQRELGVEEGLAKREEKSRRG